MREGNISLSAPLSCQSSVFAQIRIDDLVYRQTIGRLGSILQGRTSLLGAKRLGFLETQIGNHCVSTESEVRASRQQFGLPGSDRPLRWYKRKTGAFFYATSFSLTDLATIDGRTQRVNLVDLCFYSGFCGSTNHRVVAASARKGFLDSLNWWEKWRHSTDTELCQSPSKVAIRSLILAIDRLLTSCSSRCRIIGGLFL